MPWRTEQGTRWLTPAGFSLWRCNAVYTLVYLSSQEVSMSIGLALLGGFALSFAAWALMESTTARGGE